MITELTILFVSTILFLLGVHLWQKTKYLLLHGKKAKAIIYKNNYHKSGSSTGLYYPVVRFTTDSDEWITQELRVGYLPAKTEGSNLEVIYDPDEPTDLEINSPFMLVILPRLLVILGITGLISLAIYYFEFS